MNRKFRYLPVFLALALAGCSAAYVPGEISPEPPPIQTVGDAAFLMSDGVRLHRISIRSENPVALPPILAIHGGPGMPAPGTWPALDALGEIGFRVHYYHQRGSGLSSRPVDRFDGENWKKNSRVLYTALGVSRQISDIEEIRKILSAERIILIGHSYGGFLASLYAAEFPDRVAALVLIAPASVVRMPVGDPGLYSIVEGNLSQDNVEAYSAWQEEYFNYKSIWERDEKDNIALNNGLGPFWEEAVKNFAIEAAESAPGIEPWGQSAPFDENLTGGWIQPAIFLSLGRRYDMGPAFSRISAPTLLTVGTMDLASGPEALEPYTAVIPDVRMRILEGAGHFPQWDEKRFTPILVEFLKKGLQSQP